MYEYRVDGIFRHKCGATVARRPSAKMERPQFNVYVDDWRCSHLETALVTDTSQ